VEIGARAAASTSSSELAYMKHVCDRSPIVELGEHFPGDPFVASELAYAALNGATDEYERADRALAKSNQLRVLPFHVRRVGLRIHRAGLGRSSITDDLIGNSTELRFQLTDFAKAPGMAEFKLARYDDAILRANIGAGKEWSQFVLALASLSTGAPTTLVERARTELTKEEDLLPYLYALELREHVRGRKSDVYDVGARLQKSMRAGDFSAFRSMVESASFPKEPNVLYNTLASVELRARGFLLLATCLAYDEKCPRAWKTLTKQLLLPMEQPNLMW
jgi:hypothetical protein